jgi:hypothetical protein
MADIADNHLDLDGFLSRHKFHSALNSLNIDGFAGAFVNLDDNAVDPRIVGGGSNRFGMPRKNLVVS